MNVVVLNGRLTRDPERRQVGDKTACSFTLAVDRDYLDKEGNRPTDFIPCEAFGQAADFACDYLGKGRLIAVQGNFRIDKYQDAEGNNKTFAKCAVRSIQPLDSAKNTGDVNNAKQTGSTPAKPSATPAKPAKPARMQA